MKNQSIKQLSCLSISPRLWFVITLLAGLLALHLPVSYAELEGLSLTVINTNDSGEGSLRYVIENARGGSTITFDSGLIQYPATITLTTGEIVIDKNLTIVGPGVENLTISGGMVEFITIVNGTNTPAYFTSGVSYDVYAMIDVDGNHDPTSNVDYMYGPELVFVDGDTLLELDFAADFYLVL